MAFELFGYQFKRREEDTKTQQAFSPEVKDDGATVIMATGGSFGTYVDLEGTVKTEAELVTKYREMALQSEVDEAITNIIDEAISLNEDQKSVDILLDDLPLQPKTKEIIIQEFENILKLLDYDSKCYDIFKRWYVDGRIIYHAIIDEANPLDGIKELRYIDPRKIKKIREVAKKKMPTSKNGQTVDITKTVSEYYLYNEKGFSGKKESGTVGQSYVGAAGGYGTTATGLKIAKDAILHITSGLTDSKGQMSLGYLHQAIKPLNQLRILEDATLIYRISRAPERRIFYIDIGNLPKIKAEQHLQDMMAKHKNKVVYDAATGEVKDSRKFMTMLEDFWLPRREGGRGTEITTLPAGQNLGELNDVMYFQKRLYKALQVPIGRLDPEQAFTIGRSTQISRDEIRFSKFIDRLRTRFSATFLDALEKQLVLKGYFLPDEWKQIAQHIKFRFSKDNLWTELKELEILQARIEALQGLTPYIGRYVSHTSARKNVLRQSDQDIQENDEQILEEMQNPILNPPQPVDETGGYSGPSN